MSLAYIQKNLPGLAEAIHGFKGFKPGLPRSAQIREHLVALACSLRKRRPVPFYSMPDVVVWLMPVPAETETIRSIREAGVRVVAIITPPYPVPENYKLPPLRNPFIFEASWHAQVPASQLSSHFMAD